MSIICRRKGYEVWSDAELLHFCNVAGIGVGAVTLPSEASSCVGKYLARAEVLFDKLTATPCISTTWVRRI